MARQQNKDNYRILVLSLLVSIAVLIVGAYQIDRLNSQIIFSRFVVPLFRLMIFITIGLLVGQIIEARGWTKTLAVIARPMFRFGNLGNHCSAVFTTAFFSGVAANAMLLDFYKEEKITRGQLFLSNFINQLPAFFLHLPTTFFIVIPLTGLAGALYFLITFIAVVFRTVFLLVLGRYWLPRPAPEDTDKIHAAPRKMDLNVKQIWDRLKSRLPRRISSIAVYVLPIYTLVFLMNAMGLFSWLREALSGYVVTTFMPMESLSVIILSFAAEFTSGFAAAGALLDAGVLTIKQTVLALLIGNILAFPIRALRHQLPRYIGIFSPKMGTQLLLIGQGFRIMSIIIMGGLYYFV